MTRKIKSEQKPIYQGLLNEIFFIFVCFVTVITILRAILKPHIFLFACIAAQIFALTGMMTRSSFLIHVGHIGFTSALLIGSVLTTGTELGIILCLALFTVITRKVLGYCMFKKARHVEESNRDTNMYDLLYAIPCLISWYRLQCA